MKKAIVARDGAMQEVAQGEQVDNAQVPAGASSVSVHGSAGTSVSLAAPSLGLSVKGEGLSGSVTSPTTLTGGLILPRCTTHSLNSYYATDHLGTVRFTKTIDETGTEVTTSTHDYEPFGVEITPTDECDNTHKFTGHERDVETGNDYMHYRFYGASMGRFQKPDSNFDSPLANPQGWNLYSYVKGNPVNFNDPTGHDTGIPWRVQGAVSGGGTAAPGKQVLQADAFGGLSIGGTPWDDAFSSMYGEMYKASGQAANQPAQQQAQGSNTMFGANPFHLEPLKFSPPVPKLSSEQQRVAGEIANVAGEQGVSTTLAVAVGLQESSLRNLAPAFNGNYYVYGVMQVDSSHINEKIAGIMVTDHALKLEMLNIQVGVGLLAKAANKTEAEAPSITGEDYVRHVYARYQDPNVSLKKLGNVMQDHSIDVFVRNYLMVQNLGY